MNLKLLTTLIVFSFLSFGIANASSTVELPITSFNFNLNAEVVQSTDGSGNTVYTFMSFKPWTQSQFDILETRGQFAASGLVSISYDENLHSISATFTTNAVSPTNRTSMVGFFNKCGYDDFTIIN